MPEPPPQKNTLEKFFLHEPVRTSTTEPKKAAVDKKDAVVLSSAGRRITTGAEADFTWEDLKRIDFKLTMSPDSAWVPPVFRDNLFATIRHVLDPANAADGIPLSRGVNLRDLYHGHILYPVPRDETSQMSGPNSLRPGTGRTAPPDCKSLIPAILSDQVARFRKAYLDALNDTRALEGPYLRRDDGTIFQPGEAERKAIREADAAVSAELQKTIHLVARLLPDAAVLYHSYEYVGSIPKDSPLRHILTRLDQPKPVTGRYDNYIRSACHILQFDFLVDPGGNAFFRGGDFRSLAGIEFNS